MTTAWIAGASGLVGGELLRQLLADTAWERVVSVGRRVLPLDHPRLAQVVADVSSGEALATLPPPAAAFCCLGTTLRKAGSREAFRAVDHGAVVGFARAAAAGGARVLVHVTAVGADPGSRVFYNAVKGEAERDAAAQGPPSVYALRPSILDGDRAESRPAEAAGLLLARALGPLLGRYRPTPVAKVARAMIAAARKAAPGAHVVPPEEILRA
jgi:uncharacterized protein YbjT (DUF2867 family)